MQLQDLKQIEMWYLTEEILLQKTSHGWAIRKGLGSSLVLTTNGEWTLEPSPSRRLDDFDQFLTLYRFKTAEDALEMYLKATAS